MAEKLFNVVFYGILQPGREKEVVIANMARLFKTEPARLKPLFAGGRKLIKGRLTAAQAEKYLAALDNIGLVVKLEDATDNAAAQKPAANDAARTVDDSGQQPPAQADDITLAPPGADVLEHPVAVEPQPIGDISQLSMAEPGADVLTNPSRPAPVPIGDISDLSLAEPGADVLENPPRPAPVPIGDISELSLAEAGADILDRPTQPAAAKIEMPDSLSLE